jgi:hypothetical protein
MLLLFAGDAKSMQVRSPTDKNLLQLTELHASDAAQALPGTLDLRGGSFHSREAGQDMLPLLQAANELSFELVFRTSAAAPTTLLPIVSLPDRDTTDDLLATNLLLGQDARGLVLYLRLDSSGMRPHEIRLGQVAANRQTHLQICYRSGNFMASIDGRPVAQTREIRGGFSNWKPETELLIGYDNTAEHSWHGKICGIAILNRFSDEAEMQRNRRNYQQLYGWE